MIFLDSTPFSASTSFHGFVSRVYWPAPWLRAVPWVLFCQWNSDEVTKCLFQIIWGLQCHCHEKKKRSLLVEGERKTHQAELHQCLKTAMAIQDLYKLVPFKFIWFHINFWIVFSSSLKWGCFLCSTIMATTKWYNSHSV